MRMRVRAIGGALSALALGSVASAQEAIMTHGPSTGITSPEEPSSAAVLGSSWVSSPLIAAECTPSYELLPRASSASSWLTVSAVKSTTDITLP